MQECKIISYEYREGHTKPVEYETYSFFAATDADALMMYAYNEFSELLRAGVPLANMAAWQESRLIYESVRKDKDSR